jgi:hypothetical protein
VKKYYLVFMGLIFMVLFSLTACKQGAPGPSGPAGSNGSSYNPPAPMCSNPAAKGCTLTGFNSSNSANKFYATKVILSSATTVISLAYHAASGPITGQIRMAIFSDTGSDTPYRLIAESDPITPAVSSWNTVDIPDVYLNTGIYWVSVLFSNTNTSSSHTYSSGTGMLYWLASLPWGKFPETFPGGGSSNSNEISLYMNTCP